MSEQPVAAYADPGHEGNGLAYRTGKACYEKGCEEPAGTAWSPYWCFRCNVKRIDRITRQLERMSEDCPAPAKG